MERDTMNRLLDMYTNLLNYTYNSYIHTNNTIQHIELGIRDLTRQSSQRNQTSQSSQSSQSSQRHNQPIPYMAYNSHTTRNVNGGIGGYTAGANNNRTARMNREGANTRAHIQHTHIDDYLTPILTTFFNTDNLSPIVVRPTQTQIELATELVPFEENMAHNTCPITQSPFQSTDRIRRIKHCGHCFIELGLNDWFNQSVRCPVCRYDIREYSTQNRPSSSTRSVEDIGRNFTRTATGTTATGTTATGTTTTGTTTTGTTATGTTTTGTTTTGTTADNTFTDIRRNRWPNTINTTDLSNIRHNITNSQNNNDINNLLNIFTNQISESVRQYFTNNDGSHNSLENGTINIEYIFQPISNPPNNSDSIRRIINTDVDIHANDDDNDDDDDDDDDNEDVDANDYSVD
jgi:hypothetical protein